MTLKVRSRNGINNCHINSLPQEKECGLFHTEHQLGNGDGVSGDLGLGHGESRLGGSDSKDQI